jgi:hypothetical protein
MKVIDILLEAELPGGISGKLARLILPAAARTWNAEKQAAFREAVTALEDTLYLARSQPTPIATSQIDAYKVIQKAAPAHVADVEFSQAVFKAAEERVAQRLGGEEAAALKPKEEPAKSTTTKTDDAPVEKLSGIQQATKYAKNILAIGVFGAAAYDVIFNSLVEYYNNQAEFLSRVRAGTMTAEQAKQADNQQKMILVANIAAVVVFPTVVSKIPSFTAGVAVWLLRVLKLKDAPPLKLRQMKDGTLLQVTKADTEPTAVSNSLSGIRNAVWLAWIGILNSNEPIKGTSEYKLYDQSGNVTGTVGAARIAAKLNPNLTPKEIVAWFAINKMWGVDVVQWAFDAFNSLWNLLPDFVNYDTQKQAIDKAAGKPVTPNEFAKPPKKEKIGNTTWHGDWQD